MVLENWNNKGVKFVIGIKKLQINFVICFDWQYFGIYLYNLSYTSIVNCELSYIIGRYEIINWWTYANIPWWMCLVWREICYSLACCPPTQKPYKPLLRIRTAQFHEWKSISSLLWTGSTYLIGTGVKKPFGHTIKTVLVVVSFEQVLVQRVSSYFGG